VTLEAASVEVSCSITVYVQHVAVKLANVEG